jgi:hypothetical protein
MSAAAAPEGELVDIFTEDYAVVRQIRAGAPPLYPDVIVPEGAVPTYIALPPDHILARASIHGCLPDGYEIVEPKWEWFDRTLVVRKEQLYNVGNTQSGTSIPPAASEAAKLPAAPAAPKLPAASAAPKPPAASEAPKPPTHAWDLLLAFFGVFRALSCWLR